MLVVVICGGCTKNVRDSLHQIDCFALQKNQARCLCYTWLCWPVWLFRFKGLQCARAEVAINNQMKSDLRSNQRILGDV